MQECKCEEDYVKSDAKQMVGDMRRMIEVLTILMTHKITVMCRFFCVHLLSSTCKCMHDSFVNGHSDLRTMSGDFVPIIYYRLIKTIDCLGTRLATFLFLIDHAGCAKNYCLRLLLSPIINFRS